MNKFKNTIKDNHEVNDINQINNRENTKVRNKNNSYINNSQALFNPFLSPFLNFTKGKSNINNKNLLKLLSKIIKKRNKFRIFTNELIISIVSILIQIFCIV